MASVLGEAVAFDLKGLTEAQREKLSTILCEGEGVTPPTLVATKRAMWHAILTRYHDVERAQQQEAAQATVKPTPIGEAA